MLAAGSGGKGLKKRLSLTGGWGMSGGMRSFLRRLIDFCADRLTEPERWLVVMALVVVVLGSLVKYTRARPEMVPHSTRVQERSAQSSFDSLR